MCKKTKKLTKILNANVFCFALVLIAVTSFGQSITWEKTYLFSPFIRGYSVKQTTDNNYIICGNRTNHGGFVLKVNIFGDTLWLKENFPVTEFFSLIEFNSNYFVLGHSVDFTSEFIYLLKMNSNGDTLFTKRIEEIGFNAVAYSINKTNDSNLIVAGSLRSESPTTFSSYYFKIDESANILWKKIISPQSNDRNFVLGKQLSNNDYVFVGNIIMGNSPQIYVAKTNEFGDTLWTKNFGNANIYETGINIFQTENGFIVFGEVTYSNQNKKIIFLKIDNNGNEITTNIIGTSNLSYQLFSSDCVIKDKFQNRFLLTGRNIGIPIIDTFKVFLISIDENGSVIWDKKFKNDTLNLAGCSIDQSNDSGYIITGMADRNFEVNTIDPPGYLYILKTDKQGNVNIIGIQSFTETIPKNFELFQNYPNPFNPTTTITFAIHKQDIVSLIVYNAIGKEVCKLISKQSFSPGKYTITFNGKELASGLYFVEIINEKLEYQFIKTLLIK